MFKTKKFQFVELVKPAAITSAGARIFFQDQPQLRSQQGQTIYIKSIETFSVLSVPVSFTTSNPVATQAAILNAGLVLNVAGYEDLQLIPLSILNRVVSDIGAASIPYVWEKFLFKDLHKVDWTKSYLQFAQAPAGTLFSYVFGVHYDTVADLPGE